MNLLPLLKISGLFHDFGKATKLFQKKLKKSEMITESFRHEYLSALMFYHFVAGRTDEEWIQALQNLDNESAKKISNAIAKNIKTNQDINFKGFQPIARLICWLIITHHKLPAEKTLPIYGKDDALLQITKSWFDRKQIIDGNFDVNNITPFLSKSWCQFVKAAANTITSIETTEIKNFTYHQLRMILMWADHYYSSCAPDANYGDSSYKSFANSKWVRVGKNIKKEGNQKLDNHLIGVSEYSERIFNGLTENLTKLKAAKIPEAILADTNIEKFKWQNNLKSITPATKPTFLVMMASTGTGKTIGNLKAMSLLSGEKLRLTTALGLRTLTKQTGTEYKNRMMVDDITIMIGGKSVDNINNEKLGSESIDIGGEEIISSQTIEFDWLLNSNTKKQLIEAPILVCTLDHIISASEGINGGRNIISMLRLMSSDIILDELDDYSLEDMYAISRFVYLVGACGKNLLISSATLPPAIAEGLFKSFSEGVKEYGEANVNCYWIDEFNVKQQECGELNEFKGHHQDFSKKRFDILTSANIKHWGEIINVEKSDNGWSVDYAKTILKETKRKHNDWHETFNDKKISFGFVRFANIDPMISVLRDFWELYETDQSDYSIFLCPYHSRFLDTQRESIEKTLDSVLYRKDLSAAYRHPHIAERIEKAQHSNIIFLVFGTPVIEVGRDHHYNWGLLEFSSIRALVQGPGRVHRHHDVIPHNPNVGFFNLNIRAMKNSSICFERPGFERKNIEMVSHDLNEILAKEVYEKIDSRFKIVEACELNPNENVVDLEHYRIRDMMLKQDGGNIQCPASLWYSNNNSLVAHSVFRFPFRRGEKTIEFDVEDGEFYRSGSLQNDYFKELSNFEFEAWGMNDDIVDGKISLPECPQWNYHNKLGFFRC